MAPIELETLRRYWPTMSRTEATRALSRLLEHEAAQALRVADLEDELESLAFDMLDLDL